MTALLHATAPAVDKALPRPRLWVSPRRRAATASIVKAGPEQTARRFVVELRERYCRWPGAYCLWPTDASLAETLGLTYHQLRHRLELAERFGLIRRFASLAAFGRWLDLEGAPDYGLDPAGPANLHYSTRVIVMVELLPARVRPEGLYGPIGLDVSASVDREISLHGSGNFPTRDGEISLPGVGKFPSRHPIESSREENEVKPNEDSLGLFASLREERTGEPETPKPAKPLDPWDALTEAERTERLDRARRENPALAGFPNIVKALAVATLEAERPDLVAQRPASPAKPSRPAAAPISQGKPRRGTTPHTAPRQADSETHQWAEALIADAGRLSVVFSREPGDTPWRVQTMAECFEQLFDDSGGIATYKARLWEVIEGSLPFALFADAVREAVRPSTRNRGAAFSWHIRRYRADYCRLAEEERKKTDGRATRQSIPTVG